jgi:hypothetical protein
MTEDPDLEQLREQTEHGDRIDAVATENERADLKGSILDELDAIDAGDQQKTVSIWDGPVAAYIRALEEHPEQLENVGHALQQRLDLDEDEVDRAAVLRLALRVGLREATPKQYETLEDAVREQATKGL